MKLKEKVIGELEAALADGVLHAFVSISFRRREGYLPLLFTEYGLYNLTKKERGQLADAMINLAQRIRHL
jgi:hypothetical protein